MTTIRDRARRLYVIAQSMPEAVAIETIEAMLRVTRHEGINRGVDLCEKYSSSIVTPPSREVRIETHQLPERKSA